jgi:hypothetical protein
MVKSEISEAVRGSSVIKLYSRKPKLWLPACRKAHVEGAIEII